MTRYDFLDNMTGGREGRVLASEYVGGRSRATELPCYILFYSIRLDNDNLYISYHIMSYKSNILFISFLLYWDI